MLLPLTKRQLKLFWLRLSLRLRLPLMKVVTYDEHEREMLKIIDKRDQAEEAMSQAYYLITGRSPEWSNKFGYPEALEDIGDVIAALKALATTNQ